MGAQQERKFDIEELFFSITDKHGTIKSGNEVFARISGFSFAELINKPHRIIRHPDMPRVVFSLLWSSIKAGKPIAAYVKNRAKDGGYYWVLAFISIIPDGYLSVRFKPTTEYHKTIEELYARLLEKEISIESQPGGTKEAAIGASKEILNKTLIELGFPNYDAFIESAFANELHNRNTLIEQRGGRQYRMISESSTSESLQTISRQLLDILSRNRDFLSMESGITQVTQFISSLSTRIQRASLNLTVKSEQINAKGRPLSVIANTLKNGSEQIRSGLEVMVQPVKEELQQLKTGLFNISTSQLQIEMMQYFMHEREILTAESRGYSDTESEKLLALLATSAEQTFTSSLKQLRQLARAIRKVNSSFSDLQREIMGLSLLQVNGRVECARMADASEFEIILQEAMNDLTEAKGHLANLEHSFSSLDQLMTDFVSKTGALSSRYQVLINDCTH